MHSALNQLLLLRSKLLRGRPLPPLQLFSQHCCRLSRFISQPPSPLQTRQAPAFAAEAAAIHSSKAPGWVHNHVVQLHAKQISAFVVAKCT